ncbi:MAG: argininosuccinate lyase [Nitrososphaerales archaeon]
MYRSRLKGRLERDVLDYLSSIDDDLPLLSYDIIGSEAHSIMLYQQGLISRTELRKILKALESAKKMDLDRFVSEYEDVHEALEAFVVSKAGIDAGGKMHTGRSRNDQVMLDVMMKVRDDINDVSMRLIELVSTLLLRAAENKDSIMPMYTHLQHAQIGTFSHYLIFYADSLLRDLGRLDQCYQRVNRSPLGAVAIGGTSLKIDRNKVASLLGFKGIVENSIDATTSRDALIEFCSDLALIMLDLSRIAEDFVVWSSSEFNYVELADEVASSSSVMPQKKNPCPLELMRAKVAFVLGLLFSIMATVKALPSGYSRDLQDTKKTLFQAVSVTKDSLKVMNSVVKTLQVNRGSMLRSAEKSYAVSLDVAEELVKKGMSFRQAHKVVGALVKTASSKDKSLQSLTYGDIGEVVDKDLIPSMIKILQKISPKKSLRSRVSVGSPNPREQERMITNRKKEVYSYHAIVKKRMIIVNRAFEKLARQAKLLTRDG